MSSRSVIGAGIAGVASAVTRPAGKPFCAGILARNVFAFESPFKCASKNASV